MPCSGTGPLQRPRPPRRSLRRCPRPAPACAGCPRLGAAGDGDGDDDH